MNVGEKHPFKPSVDGMCSQALGEDKISCLARKYDSIHHESSLLTEEPTFTLRAQDRSAPSLVMMWIALNKTAPREKLISANDILERMRSWPKKKYAD